MNIDEIERELQFEAPDLGAVERWIQAQPSYAPLSFRAEGSITQRDTYMDTDDWAVYRAGYALRIRQKASGGEVTLKALASGGTELQARREINQAVDEYHNGGGSADSVSARVRLISNNRPVHSLFEIETQRTNYAICRGAVTLATLSLDATKVLRLGEKLRAFSRVEIEEVEPGSIAVTDALVNVLLRACDLTPAANSKFEAGLEALGLSPRSALDFGYAELSPDATAGEYAYAILRRFFVDFLAHEPGTRLGEDVEELHDMRVATRRLRASMSLFRQVLPARMVPLRDELKWLAQTLGEVRDLDVYLEWLTSEREHSDWTDGIAVGLLISDVEASRLEARQRLLEAMSTERYAQLIENMKRTLREGDDGIGAAAQPVTLYGARMLRKRYRRVRRDGKELDVDSPAEEFHALRVATKRLRYALEALEPVFTRRARRFIGATKDVQDLLGEHQDAAVAIERLRSIIARAETTVVPPAALFHTGELAEQQRNRMHEIRLAWPDTFDDLRRAHRAFAKQLRDGAKPRPEATDDLTVIDTDLPGRPPVQRPFSLLQRFFAKRHRDVES